MNDVGNKVDKMTALPKWPNNDDETSNTLMSGIDFRNKLEDNGYNFDCLVFTYEKNS